jgi:glycosyltransferase involved in cell wall biosynthesis
VLFHAVWERGAVMAVKVVQQLRATYPDAELHLAMYASPPIDLCDQVPGSKGVWCHFHGALSKAGLAELMASCDYFVYPLVAMKNSVVHKDTYASVMLESLAMGVIAVSVSVAALAEHYGGHGQAVLLDVSKEARPDLYSVCKPTSDPYFTSNAYRDRFVDVIDAFEKDPEKKEAQRRRGQEWALQQTYMDRAQRFSKAFLEE